jgi:hypothetical protein
VTEARTTHEAPPPPHTPHASTVDEAQHEPEREAPQQQAQAPSVHPEAATRLPCEPAQSAAVDALRLEGEAVNRVLMCIFRKRVSFIRRGYKNRVWEATSSRPKAEARLVLEVSAG